MNPEQQRAMRIARGLLANEVPLEAILTNPAIDAGLRDFVKEALERERNIHLVPARVLVNDPTQPDWLNKHDRSAWYYWPTLRDFLLNEKGWETPHVRSLDDSSDKVLSQLAPPDKPAFDVRGLVLGHVQSGKTANFTALISKAVDAGYRLIIVLSGIDNGLRRQTQIRLKRELVGYNPNKPGAVQYPQKGKQWHEFTTDDIHGDFDPGTANQAALQGNQPVLIVLKKNKHRLTRLNSWIDRAAAEVRATLPLLVIDDEADNASVDTRGTRLAAGQDPDDEYEEPTAINRLIRQLLSKFQRRSYVAYTATPFANILIAHDNVGPDDLGADLYPKDFFVSLPKPNSYFGSEEIFGRTDPETGNPVGGMDIIVPVPDDDLATLEGSGLPQTLREALMDFVLGGACRALRGDGDKAATMLIHTSHLNVTQALLQSTVEAEFKNLKDAWRYDRKAILGELAQRWEDSFRPTTKSSYPDRDVPFANVEPFVGPFFEAVQICVINSQSGKVLDYDREPGLKAIAIGGNKLSRGLTLEGLLVSYFVRMAKTYDTLMQMGRWFGFRPDYEDLTRIYTTPELSSWFSDLAYVEQRLREDIEVYEEQGLKPSELGPRIWQHPTMQITSAPKSRYANAVTISTSYSFTLEQTFKFPFSRPADLAALADSNQRSVQSFLNSVRGQRNAAHSKGNRPVWTGVDPDRVLEFLRGFQVDPISRSISMSLIVKYIERMLEDDELTTWTVAVCGRGKEEKKLGSALWLPGGEKVAQISRSRLRAAPESLGVITSPEDEAIGLSPPLVKAMEQKLAEAAQRNEKKSIGRAAREVRPHDHGLLLLYPISRQSGTKLVDEDESPSRKPLYENPDGQNSRDIVGLAISFPKSKQRQTVEEYVEGTVPWKPVE